MMPTVSYSALVFLVCFLAATWFVTFALLIRALQIIQVQDGAVREGITALKVAARVMVEQDDIIQSIHGAPVSGGETAQGFQA